MEQADRANLPEEIKEILARGKIVIGTKFDQPLLGKRNVATGRIEGFDAEIGRIIAQRIFGKVAEGSNIEFVETTSSRRVDYINNDTADLVISTFSMSEERKKEVDFAGPYFVAGQTYMTRGDSDIKTLKDLAGEKVCVVKGANSLDNLEEEGIKTKESEPLRDYSSCAAALAAGQYEAVSTDDIILYGFQDSAVHDFRVDKNTFTEEQYGVGMKHGSPKLREFINDTLEEAFLNGDWDKAFERTMGAAGVPRPAHQPILDRY
ncbi:glutamate ABC transporter substrate-binding protein [Stackebrandtia soli]|uniref:glutamate ABC transporter substrate-binding protein n=1 Tax=Stackebrandtia soli TaxID=1892856 RepID=UPI0039E9E0EF